MEQKTEQIEKTEQQGFILGKYTEAQEQQVKDFLAAMRKEKNRAAPLQTACGSRAYINLLRDGLTAAEGAPCIVAWFSAAPQTAAVIRPHSIDNDGFALYKNALSAQTDGGLPMDCYAFITKNGQVKLWKGALRGEAFKTEKAALIYAENARKLEAAPEAEA